jgi:cyclic dehypoxanthinyl futalosine synthase
MGSVMMEENVVSAAGTTYRLDEAMICRLIRDAGWIPAQRNQYYKVLQRWDGADGKIAPDQKPRTPGTFAKRQHKITPEEAAAYKTITGGGIPGRREVRLNVVND